MSNQTVRIPFLSPNQAALLSDFLLADGWDALWLVRDQEGPEVVTTAPVDSVIAACRALGV